MIRHTGAEFRRGPDQAFVDERVEGLEPDGAGVVVVKPGFSVEAAAAETVGRGARGEGAGAKRIVSVRLDRGAIRPDACNRPLPTRSSEANKAQP